MSETSTHVQRTRHKVPGFDPHNDAHVAAVEKKISEAAGTGFRVVGFDPDTETVTLERSRAVTEVAAERGTTRLIASLRTGAKPSDGDREAVRLENQHPGYTMTRFEPHLNNAVLEQISEDVIRCRGAVANALSVKPWLVQTSARPDGGYSLELPKTYMPSKHDDKLTEVAESVVGAPGWYVDIDPKTLAAEIIPAEPPTFQALIPFPFERAIPEFTSPADTAWAKIPLGRSLASPGQDTGPEYCLDLTSASHTLLQGLPMSGKSVNINAFAYWMIHAGAELAIVDTPDKGVDFEWIKPYVRDGGWGCESYQAMVATCSMVYAEGKRRAAALKKRGINNWFNVTDDPTFRPLVLIADEYTGLMTEERVPKALPKDHPMRIEAEATNGYKDMIATFIQKIALEMRFVGVHVFVSTQLGNTKTGVSTALKAACGNRFLMGPNASDNQRANAFAAPDAVADVPANVATTAGVSKGVGVSETEGQPSRVFKGYFATPDQFAAGLEASPRLRRTTRPEPTRAEVAEHTGMDDLDHSPGQLAGDDPWNGRRVPKAESDRVYSEDGTELTGAAAAARAAKNSGA
ncbi:hypothetical protein BH708_02735 [Brachybacterium sp. P6-10-X1]|uniref:hypothetical protein n=1 Tax=Brachybacterium sp. P6-10-X1 TaxID=1903186 RepID=UPI000971A072|nr:hypothetical protein [Brachybacterium sp. P6-10-X1]APX31808.1 hypothetical protein BH708_02735 [Brachybacterium sp. P6-10-X1]